jgi:MFS transporter, DHA2 family, methylenomycin A resistance protein
MSGRSAPPARGFPGAAIGTVRKHVALLAICLGYVMAIVDATVVNVSLPAGSLGDLLGARRVFALGLGLFTAASVACGAAPTVGVLIAARVAQDTGAAPLVPSSLALLRGVYQERRERAHAFGVSGAVAGTGAASGPILGGLLVLVGTAGFLGLLSAGYSTAYVVLIAPLVAVERVPDRPAA